MHHFLPSVVTWSDQDGCVRRGTMWSFDVSEKDAFIFVLLRSMFLNSLSLIYLFLSTNDTISRLGEYSSESNLALNKSKTKWMLVSTRQVSRAHTLQYYYPLISCNGKLLERVTTAKILGVQMDEHLTWADHITALLTSCYAALAVLRKLRNLAPYHVPSS